MENLQHGNNKKNFFNIFLYYFLFFFSSGQIFLLASDSASLSLQARINPIKTISVTCKENLIKHPFLLKSTGIHLEGLITVKFSYNMYKRMKVTINSTEKVDGKGEGLTFQHELKDLQSMIPYSMCFSDTKIPIPDGGTIFTVDNNTSNPIIDQLINVDVHIHADQVKKVVAGKYTTQLQILIKELE